MKGGEIEGSTSRERPVRGIASGSRTIDRVSSLYPAIGLPHARVAYHVFDDVTGRHSANR